MGTSSSLKRCAFSIAIVALAGCGETQSQSGTPNTIPQGSALASRAHSRSWMLPEAKNEDLLYVGSSNSEVNVYSYPKLKSVGIFYSAGAAGMCPDKDGNVWITDFSGKAIVEYAHGGTTPIATLKVPKVGPLSCAIDPTSGNLAVVGYGPENPNVAGSIIVYPSASGVPKIYRVSFGNTSRCGYNNNGNFFVIGFGYNENPPFALAELQSGSKKFKEISFGASGPNMAEPSLVQWDGRYLAVGGQAPWIERFEIRQFAAIDRGRVSFNDLHILGGAWIQGSKVVVVNEGGQGSYPPLQIDKYPVGGDPVRTLEVQGSVTVSLAPR
jgi:hypothetical protein